MSRMVKLLLRLVVFCSLITGCWLLPNAFSSSERIQQAKDVPVTVIQLYPNGNFLPAEVHCTSAHLNDANELEGFTCSLKNNTNKNITGFSLNRDTEIENNDGSISKDTSTWALESLVHQDFQESYKPILPGTEANLTIARARFGELALKAIEIRVDYVEFEDGSTLGPNTTGSKVIADIRHGAALYKDWLVREYIKRGKSEDQLAALIQTSDQRLPDELKVLETNANQEAGARTYRSLLRKLFDLKGRTEIKKYFPR